MDHPSDEVLSHYAIDPSLTDAEVDVHLAGCAPCRKRLDEFLEVDRLLADEDSWPMPGEWAAVTTPPELRAAAARRRREDAEAEALLATRIEKFLAEASGAFLWANIAENPTYHTAGVVRKLAEAADRAQYSVPLRALILAETAGVIAGMLSETRYTAMEIAALRGVAAKQEANANRHLGRFDAALTALDRAERAYRRLPRPELDLGSVTFVRATIYFFQQNYERAQKYAEESTAIFAALGQTEYYARAHHLQGCIAFEQRELGRAQVIFESIYAYGEANNDVNWIANESQVLGHCYLERRDFANASQYFRQGAVAFRDLGMVLPEVRCRWGLTLVLQREGRYGVAISHLRAIRDEFVRLDAISDAALVTLDLMETFLLLGKPREVRRSAGNIVRLFREAGMVTGALTAAYYLKQAAAMRSVTPPLIDYIRRYFRRAEVQPEFVFIPPDAL